MASSGLVGLMELHGVSEHHIPFEVGQVGGAGVIALQRDFKVFRGDADGDVTACEEIEVASDEVYRASLLIVLGISVFVRAMFGSLSLCGVVHLKVVKRRGREAAIGEKESDREDSARVDFDHFFPKSLAINSELNKDGDASLVAKARVVRVEDFVGFSVLSFESDSNVLFVHELPGSRQCHCRV